MKIQALSLVTLLSAAAAFGAYNDTTYFFSTKGPDKYADGSQVKVGEKYALVWSADEFAGFNADGSLVNANDAVLGIFALATANGNCPLASFGVPAETIEKGGNISLWVLDTRVFAADGTVTLAKQSSSTTVDSVAGAAKVAADIAVAGSAAKVAEGEATTAAATAVPADAPKPTVKDFKVDTAAGLAYVTVENTAPYLTYDLTAGDKLDNMKAGQAQNPVTGKAGETITLIKPISGNSQFIKVERK